MAVFFVVHYKQEAREEEDVQFLDDVDSDEEPIPIEIENAVIRDEELLEEIPLLGAPAAEAARRKEVEFRVELVQQSLY